MELIGSCSSCSRDGAEFPRDRVVLVESVSLFDVFLEGKNEGGLLLHVTSLGTKIFIVIQGNDARIGLLVTFLWFDIKMHYAKRRKLLELCQFKTMRD